MKLLQIVSICIGLSITTEAVSEQSSRPHHGIECFDKERRYILSTIRQLVTGTSNDLDCLSIMGSASQVLHLDRSYFKDSTLSDREFRNNLIIAPKSGHGVPALAEESKYRGPRLESERPISIKTLNGYLTKEPK